MKNILRKSLMLLMSFLAVGTIFADTETHITPTSSDQDITGTSYSIPATYIAGEGGAKVTPMASKGVKFRINRSASGLNNGVEFTVNSGYTITSIQFCGIANDNSKTADVTAVYIDGITAADKLSSFSAVTLPNKKASSAASFTISGFNATQKIVLVFGGSNMPSQVNLEYTITYTSGPAGPSNDATLSSLVYGSDQTSVPNFSSSQEHYDVELPVTYVGSAPSIQGTTTDANANITNVTQATTIPGTASITVTAEDGTTTKTYTVTFTKASADPKVLTATWANIKGTAAIDQVNKTITGQVTNGSSLTAIIPTFTGDNVTSWTPNTAQDFSNGAVNYTFKSSSNETTVYAVTITEAPAVSTDATLKSLTYGGTSVPNFSPSTLTYNIELTAGIKTPPTIAATPNDNKATVNITQASSVPGVGKVEVTAEDGTTKLTYTINYTVQVPPSGLTTHIPEIYEATTLAGGYNTPLVEYQGREYEVYYFGKAKPTGASSDIAVCYTTNMKSGYLVTSPTGTSSKLTAADNWFSGEIDGLEGSFKDGTVDAKASAVDEFAAMPGDIQYKGSSGKESTHKLSIEVQGYDQFSFVGYDGDEAGKNKMFIVRIDGIEQTFKIAKAITVRRFDLTPGKHLIEITAFNSSACKLYAFSLRLGQEPRTRYLKGNDSTQVVMQTAAIKPITYVTKYNNIQGAVTELEWIGTAANGIELTKIDGELADTLVLSGTANCATGTYHYAVVAKYNGVETSRATGTFTVKSDIKATSEIEVDVYNNETMDQITFKYYALSDNDVIVTWPNGQPAGISGSGNNGKYIIGGTPNLTGTFPQTFPYTITVNGADTIINGKITVKELNYTDKSVLYLYKNSSAYQHDDIYKYLKNKGWDLIERKALEDGLRPAEQYRNYKFIIISEDADADNAEVLAVMKSGANLPVLNLKGFTYAHQRNEDTPDGWGEPDNGAIDTIEMKGRNIKIEQPSHPIFKKMNGVSNGKEIAILDSYGQHGVMPIRVTRPGTLCLATGYTRSTSNYYEAGELQTAIHEVPADMNGGIKYICLSLSRTAVLSADGKKLIDGIVDYLTSDTQFDIDVPNCQIMTFTVAGKEGVVNHAAHSIVINMSVDEFQAADSLKNAEPVITLADPHTHVVPDSKELRYAAMGLPKKYTVTDYINLWVYEVSIRLYTPQGLEETYESGMWVNIFDIYGRKVATTNEDIYTMDLPHGMYIVVTETGSTLKIMR